MNRGSKSKLGLLMTLMLMFATGLLCGCNSRGGAGVSGGLNAGFQAGGGGVAGGLNGGFQAQFPGGSIGGGISGQFNAAAPQLNIQASGGLQGSGAFSAESVPDLSK